MITFVNVPTFLAVLLFSLSHWTPESRAAPIFQETPLASTGTLAKRFALQSSPYSPSNSNLQLDLDLGLGVPLNYNSILSGQIPFYRLLPYLARARLLPFFNPINNPRPFEIEVGMEPCVYDVYGASCGGAGGGFFLG